MAGDSLYHEAIERFRGLLAEARGAEIREPTAMTLATAGRTGRPAVRTVLLKGVDERGFTFYTNEHSRKGRALAANPRAALLFFWQPLMRQVNIEGMVEAVDASEADAYWATRPRESQLGSWASDQSQPLAARADYEQRIEQLRAEYADRAIPRPPYWSGYRVVPDRIEFWHEREFRQHDRECYYANDNGWTWTLLNP